MWLPGSLSSKCLVQNGPFLVQTLSTAHSISTALDQQSIVFVYLSVFSPSHILAWVHSLQLKMELVLF